MPDPSTNVNPDQKVTFDPNVQYPEEIGGELDWAIQDLIGLTPKDSTGQFYITSRGKIPVLQYQRWLKSEQGKQWVNSYYLQVGAAGQDRILAGYFPDSIPIAPYMSAADWELEDWMGQLDQGTQRRLLAQYGVTDLYALDDAQKAQLSGMAKQIVIANATTKVYNEQARSQSELQDKIKRVSAADYRTSLREATAQRQAVDDTARAVLAMRAKLDQAKNAEAQQMITADPEAYQRWQSLQTTREVNPVVRIYQTNPGSVTPTTGVTGNYGEYEANIGRNLPTSSYSGGTRTDVTVEEAGYGGPGVLDFAAWYKSQPEYKKYQEAVLQRYRETPYLAQQYDIETSKANAEGKTAPGFQEWVDLAPARKAQHESDVQAYRANVNTGIRTSAYYRSLVSPKTKFLRY